MEVDPFGTAANIRVARSLGLGLDEKAIEAVSHWRFKPATRDGNPINFPVQAEVDFRLLQRLHPVAIELLRRILARTH